MTESNQELGMKLCQLTVLSSDVTADGGIRHLVGGGEREDVRGARHAARGGGGAVADGELCEVQPDLADVVRLPLDQVHAGPAHAVVGGEARVLQLRGVGRDHAPAGQQPHHAANSEPRRTTSFRDTFLKSKI